VSKITSRPLTQAIAPRTNITSTSALSALSRFQPRLYSTEAATAEATPEVAPQRSTEPVTKFQDLRKLDVHENIVEALVRDFKYEDMTEVQSATINAALKGKDMYVTSRSKSGNLCSKRAYTDKSYPGLPKPRRVPARPLPSSSRSSSASSSRTLALQAALLDTVLGLTISVPSSCRPPVNWLNRSLTRP
jgi:ATP-dependent RNA helicase MSS116